MKALGNVHLFKADAEKNGEALAKEYAVRGYPTWVLMNSEKQTISRWLGYSKDHFIETLETELADLSTIDEKTARYADLPTLKDALALARYSNATGNYKSAVDYYSKAQELDPDEDYSYDILDNTIDGSYRDLFTYTDVVLAADKVFASSNNKYKVYAAVSLNRLISRSDDKSDQKKYLEMGMAAAVNANDESLERHHKDLQIEYNLHFTGEKQQAVDLKRSTYSEGWTEDADQLNSFAWWCYENKVNMEEAEQLAVKAINLSEPGRSKAMILDTAAHLCKELGKMDDAVKYMEMAVNEDPDDEGWKETLEKFKAEM